MSITDVNRLIDGMEVLNTASAQKKTEKLIAPQKKAALEQGNSAANTIATLTPADRQQALVAKVQAQLMDLGLYPGPVDGVGGMITSDAVRSYQSRNNMLVNGEITPALLSHMQFQDIGSEEGLMEEGSREY